MTRRQKDPLRTLSQAEHQALESISRARGESADLVARAKALVAVAKGESYTQAARTAGRKSNDAVSQLVSRFNQEGLNALIPKHGGGPQVVYGEAEKQQILAEVQRQPDRKKDGTATWSLTSLQRSLRKQGMKTIRTYTIFKVLHEAGYSWQKSRSWCETGTAWR